MDTIQDIMLAYPQKHTNGNSTEPILPVFLKCVMPAGHNLWNELSAYKFHTTSDIRINNNFSTTSSS